MSNEHIDLWDHSESAYGNIVSKVRAILLKKLNTELANKKWGKNDIESFMASHKQTFADLDSVSLLDKQLANAEQKSSAALILGLDRTEYEEVVLAKHAALRLPCERLDRFVFINTRKDY